MRLVPIFRANSILRRHPFRDARRGHKLSLCGPRDYADADARLVSKAPAALKDTKQRGRLPARCHSNVRGRSSLASKRSSAKDATPFLILLLVDLSARETLFEDVER